MRTRTGTWRDLFLTFRMALDLRKMSLCLAALGFSGLGCLILFTVLTGAADRVLERQGRVASIDTFASAVKRQDWKQACDRICAYHHRHFGYQPMRRITERSWVAAQARQLVSIAAPPWIFRKAIGSVAPRDRIGWLTLAGCALWAWFIWSYLGGAVTRIAAVEYTRDERMELKEASAYARKNFASYFWSPVAVAAGIGFFVLCNVAAGYLLKAVYYATSNRFFDFGNATLDRICHVLAGGLLVLGFPAMLLAGFLVLLLAIGVGLGWPLLLPAVSTEGTDAFDAISRAFSYVFGRPWRYLAYHAAALAYAVPCVLFVFCFGCCFTMLAVHTAALGMGSAFEGVHAYLRASMGMVGALPAGAYPAGIMANGVGFLLSVLVILIYGFAMSYVFSFALSAWTTMYFLLRRAVDGTDLKDIYLEEDELSAAAPAAPAPQQGNA